MGTGYDCTLCSLCWASMPPLQVGFHLKVGERWGLWWKILDVGNVRLHLLMLSVFTMGKHLVHPVCTIDQLKLWQEQLRGYGNQIKNSDSLTQNLFLSLSFTFTVLLCICSLSYQNMEWWFQFTFVWLGVTGLPWVNGDAADDNYITIMSASCRLDTRLNTL